MGKEGIDSTNEVERMTSNYIIKDAEIGIRSLVAEDVTDEYVKWLNDPEVNRYLECRHTTHTLETTIKYVNSINDSSEILLGIFDIQDNTHIGNIKIGPINKIHKQATIGLIIGKKSYWGRGIGTKVIKYISKYATEELDLENLTAGCYECNKGSYKAFINSGWTVVGTISNYWKYGIDDNKKTGQIIMQFQKRKKMRIPEEGGITLIGGGKLMKDFASFVKSFCNVLVVVSKRHHEEALKKELEEIGCSYHVSDDINNDKEFKQIAELHSRICICFGPAWIFDKKIIELFESRIFNFNGIPLPRYTGGAHYTWQILNDSKEGGAYIQQITMDIDRGPVSEHIKYKLTGKAKLPKDYEKENYAMGYQFLQDFILGIVQYKKDIELTENQVDWSQKRYFPRLLTSRNGWINWQWSGKEIVKFCEAFGEPYKGANTTVNGENYIAIKSLKLINTEYYHPYCSGLVVNRLKDKYLYIASSDGLLLCDEYDLADGEINVGDRLETPIDLLEKSRKRVRYGSGGVEG